MNNRQPLFAAIETQRGKKRYESGLVVDIMYVMSLFLSKSLHCATFFRLRARSDKRAVRRQCEQFVGTRPADITCDAACEKGPI